MTAVKNVFSNRLDRGAAVQRSQQSLEQLAARARRGIDPPKYDRYMRHARDAMVLTTRAWMRHGRSIKLFCNPSDMRWSMPRRGTVVKTTGGAVRNVWRNRYRGTYYDEGTVGITFQTGNIMPSAGWQNDSDLRGEALSYAIASPRIPPGLMDFYDFIELLDQPMMLGSWENRHVIIHHSRVFPRLYMEGYFTEDNFSFSEIATDGNRLQWEATFQIYRTSPKMWNRPALERAYESFVNSNQAEAYGWGAIERYNYAEGLGDVPNTFPSGDPLRGTTGSKKITTVASSSKQDKQVNDAVNKIRNDPSVSPFFF